MLSKDINENCEKMQFEIQRGNIHVDKLYLSIVKNMLDFLKEFIAFAEKIKPSANSHARYARIYCINDI